MEKQNSIYFDPVEPIDNKEDFTKELIIYRDKNNVDLFIHKESMEPLVEIDGVMYRGILEYPSMIRTDNPILKALSFPVNTFGYRIVALHPVDEEV